MKLVFASDSFKESLSSKRTAELLTKAAREEFGALNGEIINTPFVNVCYIDLIR